MIVGGRESLADTKAARVATTTNLCKIIFGSRFTIRPLVRTSHFALLFSGVQLTIDYFQRKRGTKRMVDMFFEFSDLCTTIPPLEYGGNEVLLEYFASKVNR